MGVVSHVMGTEGSTYTSPEGKGYELTGWTFAAMGAHEQYLEKRAEESISRSNLPTELKAAALVAHSERVAAFKYSYGSDVFSESLKSFPGLGHFFWQLARVKTPSLKLAEAVAMVQADPGGVSQAVHDADPQNRATAEAKPKTSDDGAAS
jgi:hypothetical protein